jgi:hypothetical protein
MVINQLLIQRIPKSLLKLAPLKSPNEQTLSTYCAELKSPGTPL